MEKFLNIVVSFVFFATQKVMNIVMLLSLVIFPVNLIADEDPHAHHKAMMKKSNTVNFKRSEHTYHLPDIKLLDPSGNQVSLSKILEKDKSIALNFIFTTCNTICPLMSGTFSQLDKKIQKIEAPIKLVSISIDPEFDTPRELQRYSKVQNASDKWSFYTGSRDDIIKLQTAFNAYRGSKMNHVPLTLLKNANKKEWIRLDGFANAQAMIKEMLRVDNQISLKN